MIEDRSKALNNFKQKSFAKVMRRASKLNQVVRMKKRGNKQSIQFDTSNIVSPIKKKQKKSKGKAQISRYMSRHHSQLIKMRQAKNLQKVAYLQNSRMNNMVSQVQRSINLYDKKQNESLKTITNGKNKKNKKKVAVVKNKTINETELKRLLLRVKSFQQLKFDNNVFVCDPIKVISTIY